MITIISAIANLIQAIACLFLGTNLPFHINQSVGLTQGMFSLFGSGYGLSLISTFDRIHRQALNNGYDDSIKTYMAVSGMNQIKRFFVYQCFLCL